MSKKINVEELKKIQLKILDFVSSFCEENRINYWIDCGTLIGAIRHKGYIPWDDDIDVGMLREDYDKFMKLFNKQKSQYVFKCIENDKKFYYPFGKVVDTNTVLYEPDEKHGTKLSVNIDIFVYDNAPDEEKKLNKMFRIRNIYRKLHTYQLFPKSMYNKNVVLEVLRRVVSYILKIFPKGYFTNKIADNSKKYVNCKTKRIGNFMGFNRFVCDKDAFSSFIDVEFEGKKYKAPIGYDKWLKCQYGDYMKLPPKEKQVSHHSFVAYYIEK